MLESVYFGALLSLAGYGIGVLLKKKKDFALFNPLLIAIIICIVILKVCNISYDAYYNGAKYISYLLTPATICLAVPLYEQMQALKDNFFAIIIGIITGVLSTMISILALCLIFRLDHIGYVTLLPKSVTTAIGMGISEELGGYVSITVAIIILTGILGNMMAKTICRIFHITEPVVKGIGIGSASHAIGTVKAMEMGQVEGAMSSLSIVISGLLTVVAASIFSLII